MVIVLRSAQAKFVKLLLHTCRSIFFHLFLRFMKSLDPKCRPRDLNHYSGQEANPGSWKNAGLKSNPNLKTSRRWTESINKAKLKIMHLKWETIKIKQEA